MQTETTTVAEVLTGLTTAITLFATWREHEEPGEHDVHASALAKDAGEAYAARDWGAFVIATRRFLLYFDARLGGAAPVDALATADAAVRALAIKVKASKDGTLRIHTTTR